MFALAVGVQRFESLISIAVLGGVYAGECCCFLLFFEQMFYW
jgi:hypothetical protein